MLQPLLHRAVFSVLRIRLLLFSYGVNFGMRVFLAVFPLFGELFSLVPDLKHRFISDASSISLFASLGLGARELGVVEGVVVDGVLLFAKESG